MRADLVKEFNPYAAAPLLGRQPCRDVDPEAYAANRGIEGHCDGPGMVRG